MLKIILNISFNTKHVEDPERICENDLKESVFGMQWALTTWLASHSLILSPWAPWALLCRGLFPSIPPQDPFLRVVPVMTFRSSQTSFALIHFFELYEKPLFLLLVLEVLASLSFAILRVSHSFISYSLQLHDNVTAGTKLPGCSS